MNIYAVGGSVRDELLGLPVQDRDYVVVGATPEQMLEAGYNPVGADFPVFLHPQTHEEYALARTERKTAPGYKGFVFHTSPDVTLEQDLRRRDLTINAIARDAHGNLIDPYGGAGDLKQGVLRHVGDSFAEDPVRILRAARFAARFANRGFRLAAETLALMNTMVEAGEVDHLVPERVWREMSKGLMEDTPSRMFEVLRACGALTRLLPGIDRLFGVPQAVRSHPEIGAGAHVMLVLDYAASRHHPLPIRFAALCQHLGDEDKGVQRVQEICNRLRVPGDCGDLARMVARRYGDVHAALQLNAGKLLAMLDDTDALRRPARFRDFVEACACDHHGRPGFADVPYPPREYLLAALSTLQALNFAGIAQSHANDIAGAIDHAKFGQLQRFIEERNTA